MEARLEAASLAGDLGAFLQLLQEDSLLLDRLSTTHHTSNNPLHMAALLGHADFASEILSRRPKLAQDLNEQGFSPLHLASANGHLSVVKELLKVGTDLCLIRDKDGFMPIHTAVIKGKIGVVKELIDACPETAKAATCQGETVVHLAVRSNHFEAVEFLVEKLDGDEELLNSKDEKGNTILHLTVARRQLQILKFLLSKPVIQVNSFNLKGFTPLDVLLELPSEHGDLILGEMIRAAGGKKAEEESPPKAQNHPIQRAINPVSTSPTRSNWKGRLLQFFYLAHRAKASRRDLRVEREYGDTRSTLMIVATLIATVTFQAGMNPPGGFVQDGGPNVGNLDPGQAVLGHQLSPFLIFDMVGLFASLSIILLLICVVPRKKRMLTRFLKWVMWIAVFSTAIAFAMGLRKILPISSFDPSVFFLLGWYGIFVIAMDWLIIRFSSYLLRKVGCLKKRSLLADEVNIRRMGVGTIVKRIVIFVVVSVVLGVADLIVFASFFNVKFN
uniref:Ankyrin repeat-containing protein BDA1-like n=1 Tax=Elaeis guineensis var. tenera TaxID=51953 RepID=A0A6J0PHM5_ELAGV|nr:ankyrin repeat-containing protein BDA1-like [Elaeis guineensis]